MIDYESIYFPSSRKKKSAAFTRCYINVYILYFLLFGERFNPSNENYTIINYPGDFSRKNQNQQFVIRNKDIVKKLINFSNNDSYTIVISINGNILDHIFVIIRYFEDGKEIFSVLQSYIEKYCVIINKYDRNYILNMIDDLYFYDHSIFNNNKILITSKITSIWKKYFLVDLEQHINTYSSIDINYYYRKIDPNMCYKYLHDFMINAQKFIINPIKNVIFPAAEELLNISDKMMEQKNNYTNYTNINENYRDYYERKNQRQIGGGLNIHKQNYYLLTK